MTLTIRDISEAHQKDIDALDFSFQGRDILVAVAEQLECFERRYFEPTLSGRTDTTRRAEWDLTELERAVMAGRREG